MAESNPTEFLLYIGTYTRREAQYTEKSEGIYIYRLNMETGALTRVGVATGIENPSFVALHPQKPFLYSVCEVDDFGGDSSGALAAFAIDETTGELTALNHVPSRGTGPCHVCVDGTGQYLFAANYGSGSAVMLSIQEDGSLSGDGAFVQHEGSSVNVQRQAGPHAHSVTMGPAGQHVYVADLGLDRVMIYRIDWAEGKMIPSPDQPWVQTAPGAGPRHMEFHPNGRFAYVINELNSTLTAYTHDADAGTLQEIGTLSTLPADFDGNNSCADIHVHPNGKFVYGSNRGHNSIAIFAVDAESGALSLVGHESTQGETPRNFAIDPTGTYLLAANQDTDNIIVFRIDPENGTLESTGNEALVGRPVCIKIRK